MKLQPDDPYATSKACADLIAQSYFKTYNLNNNLRLPEVPLRSITDFKPFASHSDEQAEHRMLFEEEKRQR